MVDASGGLVFVGLEFDVYGLFAFKQVGWDGVFFFYKPVLIPFADIVNGSERSIIYKDRHIPNSVFIAPISYAKRQIVSVAGIHDIREVSTVRSIAPRLAVEVAAGRSF